MAEKNRQLELLRNENSEGIKQYIEKRDKPDNNVENVVEKVNKSDGIQKVEKIKKTERSGFITSLAPDSTLPSLQNIKFRQPNHQNLDSNRSNKSDKDKDYFKNILEKYDKIRKGML